MSELTGPNNVKDSLHSDNIGFNNDSNQRSNFEMSDGDDNDLRVVETFSIPGNLKKTFIFVICLFVLAVVMIFIGTIIFITTYQLDKSVPFWSIGGIVFIPGGYYAYQFYKANKSKSLEERNEILEDIPEL